ncbi:MAG: anaerobic ribonucleoside-triphosphate reductase activating protein [Candidatus Ranarchaeia archaeon]
MRIGGVQWTSLMDYPKKICSTIFTVGCNFRCPFCHNRSLVIPSEYPELGLYSEDKVLSKLESRKKYVKAIAITGGEPLLQKDLTEFVIKLRNLDFKIKIDTNGSFPKKLEKLINGELVDYIAVDFKSPLEKYDEIVQYKGAGKNLQETLGLISKLDKKITTEIRTTYVPPLIDLKDLQIIAEQVKKYNFDRYVIQKGINIDSDFVDKKFKINPINLKELKVVIEKISPMFTDFEFREN